MKPKPFKLKPVKTDRKGWTAPLYFARWSDGPRLCSISQGFSDRKAAEWAAQQFQQMREAGLLRLIDCRRHDLPGTVIVKTYVVDHGAETTNDPAVDRIDTYEIVEIGPQPEGCWYAEQQALEVEFEKNRQICQGCGWRRSDEQS